METAIFKKMKAKAGYTALALYAPDNYPTDDELVWNDAGPSDFVHIFVRSKAEFAEHFGEAIDNLKEGGLLWISYPKGSKKQKYDINRDSLWDLVIPMGWHPVSQVSLGDEWSAIRLRSNEPGTEYVRPNNMKVSK